MPKKGESNKSVAGGVSANLQTPLGGANLTNEVIKSHESVAKEFSRHEGAIKKAVKEVHAIWERMGVKRDEQSFPPTHSFAKNLREAIAKELENCGVAPDKAKSRAKARVTPIYQSYIDGKEYFASYKRSPVASEGKSESDSKKSSEGVSVAIPSMQELIVSLPSVIDNTKVDGKLSTLDIANLGSQYLNAIMGSNNELVLKDTKFIQIFTTWIDTLKQQASKKLH